MLQNPAVRRWLGDIEPAWTLLDQPSFTALRQPPSTPGSALKLTTDLTPDEIALSAIARSALASRLLKNSLLRWQYSCDSCR
jgi:hypothetical protein